jgi:hypothetical protein
VPTITYKGIRIRLTRRAFEMLDYAAKYPTPGRWHDIGGSDEDRKAAEQLKVAGLIEVREFSNQYRLTP